jgi:hypothetical protein
VAHTTHAHLSVQQMDEFDFGIEAPVVVALFSFFIILLLFVCISFALSECSVGDIYLEY